MENQTKQRIVGIIVIVAFVAILVPFLFSGSKKNTSDQPTVSLKIPGATNQTTEAVVVSAPAVSATNSSANSQVNFVSETVVPAATRVSEASVAPSATASLASPTALAAEKSPLPAPQPVVVITKSAEHHQSPSAKTVLSTFPTAKNTHAKPNKAVHKLKVITKPTIKPASKHLLPNNKKITKMSPVKTNAKILAKTKIAKPKSKIRTKIVKKNVRMLVPAKAPTRTKSAVVTGVAAINWTIHVGSFFDEKRAQLLLAQLRAKGYQPKSERIITPHGTLTRVSVGHSADKAKLNKVAKKISQQFKVVTRISKE